jgi:hypothetical protein
MTSAVHTQFAIPLGVAVATHGGDCGPWIVAGYVMLMLMLLMLLMMLLTTRTSAVGGLLLVVIIVIVIRTVRSSRGHD